MNFNASTGLNYHSTLGEASKSHAHEWEDLAPDICRQRLVIEGTLHNVFLPEEMTRYCHEITEVLNMTEVTSPVLQP